MPALPETPEEVEARRLLQLAEQRTMLEHLRDWLRMRNLSQRHVAQALGVSDASVSNWIAGKQQMSVGQLRQIALLLNAKPEDLLRAPPSDGLAAKVEETLAVMDALTDDEWATVMQAARAIAAAKQKS